MRNVSDFTQCANCGACYNVCPVNAIRVNEDGLFYRVEVDAARCIDCGKCLCVCPVNVPQYRQNLKSACYAVHSNEQIVKASSSGGVFSAIAEWILEQGGVVYAACYSEDRKKVVFQSTDTVSLEELRRSKYVESMVKDCFSEIRNRLNLGRIVLFCGTPCQVAGLLRYLNVEHENLYTCDFSCGGLPSHKIYQEYLSGLEQRFQSKVKDVNFRPKSLGWETHAIKITFGSGRVYESAAALDPYFDAFVHKHFSVRDYCLDCSFAKNHYADVVLADFWKYQEMTGRKNHKGISMVIANSPKGEQIMSGVAERLICRELNLDDASYNMKQKKRSKEFLEQRHAFLDGFQTGGMNIAARCLDMPSGLNRLKIKIKSAIKKLLWGVK